MSSLLLILVLSLSMHACTARCLGVICKKSNEVHLLNKVLDKAYHKISIPPTLRPSMETAEEIRPVGSDKQNSQEKWGGAKSSIEEDDSKGITSGSKIKVLSPEEDLQQATKIGGWKRHPRVMLGSAPHDVEETVDSKEGDAVEDVVVMDYAQPHRKPPIHNSLEQIP